MKWENIKKSVIVSGHWGRKSGQFSDMLTEDVYEDKGQEILRTMSRT